MNSVIISERRVLAFVIQADGEPALMKTRGRMRPLGVGMAGRGGIVVSSVIPPAPAPQLQAFVWCRRHGNQPTLKEGARQAPLPGALMVGRFRARAVDAGSREGGPATWPAGD